MTRSKLTTIAVGLAAFTWTTAQAATPCVNPAGAGGCFSTISAAVTAATPGSTIQVAAGTYKESVAITKTVLLIGDAGKAIIDAKGKSTGIFINGMASAPAVGISGVVISGLTIRNANFEGILAANATGLTITDNVLYSNNLGLIPGDNGSCPGQPAYETNEGFDCGEAVHLMGVDHSVISNNDIENNAGGILVSDETGPSYENLITGNKVVDNAYDCGITLASHGRAPNLPAGPSYGVFHITVSHNVVQHNGSIGQGAGVGIYAGGPGNTCTANVVIDNVLTDNGIGGVSMHNHAAPGVNGVPAQAPGVNLSDNVIVGNYISGNSGDNDDPNSPGPTGISILSFAPLTGTVISQNTFASEVADIVFNAPAGTIEAHLNNFNSTAIAVDAEGPGYIDASQNWWGCPDGPGAAGCATTQGASLFTQAWRPMPMATPHQNRPF